ncbi:SMC-Scp complex subunit ScpB [Hyphococcus sp.]|uniref:SMC-Scp complex subunit ScpB n=1 Tax=Hyphococcus sp. TaxID=2038636 RepID=UPI003CCC3A4F
MMESDAGRDFRNLDARGAQEALADELSDETEVASVTDGQDDIETGGEDTQSAADPDITAAGDDAAGDSEDGAPAGSEPADSQAAAVEWDEEDMVEHTRMLEALLFAAAEPLDRKSIADRLPAGADIAALIERLKTHYEGRGVEIAAVDGKWRFVTAADVAHVLRKEKTTQRKLSRAALETLAIIAYHQPCTRADIEDVRGVQVAKGSLDQLLEIGWVKMRGKRRDVPGRPTLYGTTQSFLEHFGLETVTDLPGLADLKAAGMLDARLPPGFAVPSPVDSDDDDDGGEDGESGEFAQDFLDEEADETAGA